MLHLLEFKLCTKLCTNFSAHIIPINPYNTLRLWILSPFFLVRRCWILRESKSQQQVWVQAEIQTQAADSKTYIPSHLNLLPCMEWNQNLSNLESLCSRSKIVFSNTFSQIHPNFYYPILSSCVSLVIFLTLTIRL